MNAAPPNSWRLEVRGLNKAYNVPVLQDFDFRLRPGEVHALVGSNGAGKSTFARILCGLTAADGGEVLLDGHPHAPRSKATATAAGVVMVLQELNLLPTLSVAENLFFDRLPQRGGFIRRGTLREQARAALRRVGLEHLDPDLPAGRLGVGQQQLVEIAAALDRECRVLILDEPTAALTATETEVLFDRLRDLQAAGVGIIYVSHRMDEIRRIADRVTVLRDGRRIATHEAAAVALPQLIAEMAGRESAYVPRGRQLAESAPTVLEVRGLSAGDRVREVGFCLQAGEVLGIAGLVGAGRTELLRAIYGADPITAGEIRRGGERIVIASPRDAVAAGIGMVPESRRTDGLLLPRSICSNATLAAHDRFQRRGWLDRAGEHAATRRAAAELDLKHDDPEQAVAELSGGNQQKVVMARWLLRDAAVLLLDEPTRGIDVAAKETIYRQLAELAAAGKGLVMVSSELPELMANCDRILVLSAGRLVAEFRPPDWSEAAITAAAFRGHLDGAPGAAPA